MCLPFGNRSPGYHPTTTAQFKGVDLIDSVLSPLFVAATLVMSGIGTVGIDRPFPFHLSDALYAAAGVEITWAFIATIVVIVVAWVTNEARDLEDFSQEQLALVGGMILMTLAVALVPPVAVAFEMYWYASVMLIFLNSAGYYLLAYY